MQHMTHPLFHVRECYFVYIDFRKFPGYQLEQEFQYPILTGKQTGCDDGGFDTAAADFNLGAL